MNTESFNNETVSSSGRGIEIQPGVSGTNITNVVSKSNDDQGVLVGENTTGVNIQDSVISNNSGYGVLFAVGSHSDINIEDTEVSDNEAGILVYDLRSDAEIDNVTVDSGNRGIRFKLRGTDHKGNPIVSRNISIEDSKISTSGDPGQGIVVDASYPDTIDRTMVKNVSVRNNIIENVSGDTSSEYYSISVVGPTTDSDSTTPLRIDGVRIINNELRNISKLGMALLANNTTVSDNTIRSSNGTGVSAMGYNISIENNEISNIGRASLPYANVTSVGIFIINGSDEVDITDNVIADLKDSGIRIDRTSSPIPIAIPDVQESHIDIAENTIKNGSEGIRTGEKIDTTRIEAHLNNITGNSNYGVLNENNSVLNATGNYWGESDGPSGNVTDPITGVLANGSGDRVSASTNNTSKSNVHFDSFLTSPPDSNGEEILTSSGDIGAPNERVTISFTLTNTLDEPAGYIINITTDIPDPYTRDDDGGTWKPSEKKWAFLNVSSGEQRMTSYTYTVPDNATVGNFTVESEALDSVTRSVVDTAEADIRIQSDDSLIDAIDENDNCQLEDSELLRAIDLWQNDEEVPNTGGQTIEYTFLLDITDKWSNDAILSYDPEC